jgi:hypothetical protein
LADFETEASEKLANAGKCVGVRVSVGRKRVASWALAQAEFVDVAGESCLGNMKSTPCKLLA